MSSFFEFSIRNEEAASCVPNTAIPVTNPDLLIVQVIHGIVPDSSRTAAEAFQVLGEVDLADPNPSAFIKVWLYSHPPLAERLAFAHEYDPWSKGESPEFVR